MVAERPVPSPALPQVPDKRYFSIGEVSELCAVKPHVLRYWEQEFTQLRPMKRRGNRRYYQHHEVLLVRRIRELLYEHGYTISGARNRLADAGARANDRSGSNAGRSSSSAPVNNPAGNAAPDHDGTPHAAPGRYSTAAPGGERGSARPVRGEPVQAMLFDAAGEGGSALLDADTLARVRGHLESALAALDGR